MDTTIEKINTVNLGNLSLDYSTTEGLIYPSTALEVHEQEISTLKTKFENLQDLKELNITSWGVDFGCLVNECKTPTVTLGDALNNISKAICEGVVPPVFETQPEIVSGEIINDELVLTKDNSDTINVNINSLLDNTNLPRVISADVLGNDLVFTRDDGTQFGADISTLLNSPQDSNIISGTVVGNELVLVKDDSTNIIIDLSDFVNTTPEVVSGQVSSTILTLTKSDNSTVDIDVSSLLDNTDTNTNLPRIVSGNVSGNNLVLTRDDSTTFTVDLSSFNTGGSDGNDFITSASLSGNTLNITGTGGAGASVNLGVFDQNLSISGNSLSISGGNTVSLPSSTGGVSQQSGSEGSSTININLGGALSAGPGFSETLEWTKTGDIVHFQTTFPITVSSLSANSTQPGNVTITGMPFSASIRQAVNYSLDAYYGQLIVAPFLNQIINTTISISVVFQNLLNSTYSSSSLPEQLTISGSYIAV